MPAAAARPLHHIGYWADDLEEAAWRAHRDLGIGPFALAEHVTFRRFPLAGREPDAPVVFDHSAAFAAWGPIVLELGQVHSIDDELAGLYGVREGAVSHVSWLAPDLDDEAIDIWHREAGIPLERIQPLLQCANGLFDRCQTLAQFFPVSLRLRAGSYARRAISLK